MQLEPRRCQFEGAREHGIQVAGILERAGRKPASALDQLVHRRLEFPAPCPKASQNDVGTRRLGIGTQREADQRLRVRILTFACDLERHVENGGGTIHRRH